MKLQFVPTNTAPPWHPRGQLVSNATSPNSASLAAQFYNSPHRGTLRAAMTNEISLLSPHRSHIVGLPGSEATVRGFSGVLLLLVDQLDIEMDAQGPDLEKRFTKHEEDMRGSSAFAALSDRSGFATAFRYQIHLSREYRRTLSEFIKIARRTPDVIDSFRTPVENRPFSEPKP